MSDRYMLTWHLMKTEADLDAYLKKINCFPTYAAKFTPYEYPFFITEFPVNSDGTLAFDALYRSDLKTMLELLDVTL